MTWILIQILPMSNKKYKRNTNTWISGSFGPYGSGVALVAIKELINKNKQLEQTVKELSERLDKLEN